MISRRGRAAGSRGAVVSIAGFGLVLSGGIFTAFLLSPLVLDKQGLDKPVFSPPVRDDREPEPL